LNAAYHWVLGSSPTKSFTQSRLSSPRRLLPTLKSP
jgi:hypothetical protein